MGEWRTWRAAMADALYGGGGFYRPAGTPARHFRTSAGATTQWADAVAGLARRVDAALGEPDGFAVVDVGAGGGELIAGVARHAPQRWRLVGVDVAPRPPGLPERVAWHDRLPPRVTGLLVAVEWLDVVPVDVVEATEAGPRLIEVAGDGTERFDGPPSEEDLAWLSRWWPLTEPGDRAEVGLPRDAAWADAVARVDRGVALAVDYAADPARDVAGTLTGYRCGRQIAPVPDGSCDLTAHVLVASCLAAVDLPSAVLSQREALRRLGIRADRPGYAGDAVSYLRALSVAGEAAELLDPSGLGGFTWLVHAKDVPLPF